MVFVLILLGVGFVVYLGQRKSRTEELYYSGTIEATTSELAFQVGGRIVNIHVDEGQGVEKGQLIAELDMSEYQARYEQAQANLNRVQQNIRKLETVLKMYRGTLPAQVARAEAGVLRAKAVLEEAQRNKKRYDNLFRENIVSQSEWEAVKLNYETARTRLSEEEALLKQARSNLRNIEVTKKEVELARAELMAAKANLDFAGIQLRHTGLFAPFSGIITSRNVEIGEVVTPNREVLTLSDLSTVKLKIYIDETEIGKVKPGQKVEVKIDTFPGKIYTGRVSFISHEAEFTPKTIQTHRERVKLVYLVKVSIPNPDLELKTGMPADAWLRE